MKDFISNIINQYQRRRFIGRQTRALRRGLRATTLPEGYRAAPVVRNGKVYLFVYKEAHKAPLVGPQYIDSASSPVYNILPPSAVQRLTNRTLAKMKNRSGLYSE